MTTGIGTIWSALVSADQLAHSREQDADKQRQQAATVSYWVDHAPNGDARLHLMNRSADPVADIRVLFNGGVHPPVNFAGWPLFPDPVLFWLELPSLPPCTDSVIEAASLMYSPEVRGEESDSGVPPWMGIAEKGEVKGWKVPYQGDLVVSLFKFVDRNGESWVRSEGKLENRSLSVVEGTFPSDYQGRVASEPFVKAAEGCEGGDSSG
ncbi:hypothetical protein ABZ904_08550 [Streptomyces sp. NPDC046900]|uniref:hypothetical protein n=1 Tax=Streptomyces sp. NPDC046900 TaxID=3155473 RepID=UPI0033EFD4F2